MTILCEDWKLIDYKKALSKKLKAIEKIKHQLSPEKLIFCSHPPVVTAGRAFQQNEILSWNGDFYPVSRGGRATYHGPNQLMIYPLLDMRKKRRSLPPKDLPAYLRLLENVFIQTLKQFNLSSHSKASLPTPMKKEKPPNTTGVWVKEKKLVSIGVAFKHWISYHGASINLEKDVQAFQGIQPCGFSHQVMSSVEEALGKKISRKDFKESFKNIFLYEFQSA